MLLIPAIIGVVFFAL
jgi:hypothetical protein